MKSRFSTFGLLALVGLGIVLNGCSKGPTKTLQVGDKMPELSFLDGNGKSIKLSDIQPGWYMALFFYRGSWCGTCSNRLLDLKQDLPNFSAEHVAVAALSSEGLQGTISFNDQWRFPFPLLCDSNFKLIDAMGFRDPKKGHNGEDISHVGIVVIAPDGIIRYIHMGKEAWDQPTDDEILYTINQIRLGTPVPQTGGGK